ncbi:MAG: hypothetical protein KatS3mg077_3017 [Candidatus Binatia bacterium]|nr:MAG: hypothetical protein KatS3mg077_3017 [Candidatus Binatia bacterium]
MPVLLRSRGERRRGLPGQPDGGPMCTRGKSAGQLADSIGVPVVAPMGSRVEVGGGVSFAGRHDPGTCPMAM